METQTATAHRGTRIDVYALITDQIIEQLNKGTVPWRKPWTEAGLPQNLISGKLYRGINVFLLASLGYVQNYFLSYKQVQQVGGKVKKDEKGYPVVYWNYVEKQDEAKAGEEEEASTKKTPYLRYYTVFNIAQCENIPADKVPSHLEITFNPIFSCEKLVEIMPTAPRILHKEQKAYYDPLKDFVNMPKQKSFASSEAYYSTLFHELVHSTGHHSRLSRPDLLQMSEFGSEPYSREELVAEIGACYLQSFTGITADFQQNTAYIQGWLKKLHNDRKFIFSAATQAQKAIDYILNATYEAEDKQQIEE